MMQQAPSAGGVLTPDAIARLLGHERHGQAGGFQPTLQVINSMPVMNSQMLAVSDGHLFVSAMMSHSLEAAVGVVQKHMVFRLVRWNVLRKGNKELLQIEELQGLCPYDGLIGNPTKAEPTLPEPQVQPLPLVAATPPRELQSKISDPELRDFCTTQKPAIPNPATGGHLAHPCNPYAVAAPAAGSGCGSVAPQCQQTNHLWHQQPNQQQTFQDQGFGPVQGQLRQPIGVQPQQQFVPPVATNGGASMLRPGLDDSQVRHLGRQYSGPAQYGPTSQLQRPLTRSMSNPASGAPRSGSTMSKDLMEIAALSPYQSRRWRIRGRMVVKSDVRHFNSARGPGKLFKIDIVDSSGPTCATFFGQGVDDWYDRLVVNKIYFFAGGVVKAGNPKFDSTKHAITFDANVQIEEAQEDPTVPGISFQFQTIDKILASGPGVVDLKGVVSEVGEVSQVTMKKDGTQKPRRSIAIWDSSGPAQSCHIEFTIWGDRALQNDILVSSPIFIKCARVGEFNGKTNLNSVGTTSISFEMLGDPGVAEDLRRDWTALGASGSHGTLLKSTGGGPARRATCQEMQQENLGLGPALEPGQPIDPNGPRSVHKHEILATVTMVFAERPPYYPACNFQVDDRQGRPRACNKKLADEGNGWRCANGHVCEQPNYRFLLRARVGDHTGVVDVNSFDEAGRKLFGCDANVLAALWDDDARVEEKEQLLKKPIWQRFLFIVKSQREVWQDEERVKISVSDVLDADMISESRRQLSEIHAALGPAAHFPSQPSAGGA